eukprot:gene15906-21573_t
MDIDVYTASLYSLVLIIIMIALKLFTRSSPNDNIPAVKGGLPFFGHVFTMLKGSPWDTMAKWVHEYGKVYKFHLFGSDAICVNDPSLTKIILSTKLSSFRKDTQGVYKPFMVLLGNGIVTSEGLSWRNQRTFLSSHLRIDILEFVPKMTIEAIRRLSIKLNDCVKNNTTIEMSEQFRHLTLQVIAEAVLSISAEESDNTFAHMYLPIVEEGNSRVWNPHRMYIPSPAWFKFRNDVARLNNYVLGLIQKRLKLRAIEKANYISDENLSRPFDVLDKILGSINENDWNEQVANDICDQIKTFILAGHETSASMLGWALYELSREEGKQSLSKLQTESKQVFQGCLKTSTQPQETNSQLFLPNKEQISKLEYSECCLRESLRKYSVVPTVARVAAEPIDLNEYHIAKGSMVMIGIQGIHHNPEFWPNPFEYQPERFLEEIQPYTFLPFTEGPRVCLGQHLSLLESKIVLSSLLSTYRFELINRDEAGLRHAYMVPIIPKHGQFYKIHHIHDKI